MLCLSQSKANAFQILVKILGNAPSFQMTTNAHAALDSMGKAATVSQIEKVFLGVFEFLQTKLFNNYIH